MFNCAVQWHQVHSRGCATPVIIPLPNLTFLNWHSIPIKHPVSITLPQHLPPGISQCTFWLVNLAILGTLYNLFLSMTTNKGKLIKCPQPSGISPTPRSTALSYHMSESFELGTVGEGGKTTFLYKFSGWICDWKYNISSFFLSTFRFSRSEVGNGIKKKKNQAAEENPMIREMKENTEIGGFYPPFEMKIWRFSRVTLLRMVVTSHGC